MRYYGCKERLLDFIENGVEKTGINHGSVFCDLFSGTTTVARYFKKKGYTTYANDILEFSYALARAYIQNNTYPLFRGLYGVVPGINGTNKNIDFAVDYLNNLKPIEGFIYKNYCPGGTEKAEFQRMYFTDFNGKKIDAIRTRLHKWYDSERITQNEFYILLSSLLEAVPFVANISGNYAAYLKDWDPRAHKPLTLRTPNLIQSERKNKAFREDSNQLVRKIQTDILYLDPPYNSRQYASNYFLLELIAEGWFNGNRPKIYGKTGMREYEEQKSAYCQKSNVSNTFQDLIKHIKTRYILLSYNDEGLLSEGEIKDVLSTRGEVNIFKRPYRRYRSINQDETDRTNVYEKLYFVKVTKGAVNG